MVGEAEGWGSLGVLGDGRGWLLRVGDGSQVVEEGWRWSEMDGSKDDTKSQPLVIAFLNPIPASHRAKTSHFEQPPRVRNFSCHS
jgi:hypothetical protein